METNTNRIDKSSLFGGLPPETLANLLSRGRRMKIAAGQTLFLVGDPGDGCYFIDSGLLKASVVSEGGAECILGIFGPGTICGELSVIDGAPRSASVSPVRDSEVVYISRSDFASFLRTKPEISQRIMELLAHRLREIDESVLATNFLSMKGRTARTLLSLADAFGSDVGSGRVVIRQKITQGDLAAMTGIARENVSRIVNDWMRLSLISRISGYYCIEDKALLQRELGT